MQGRDTGSVTKERNGTVARLASPQHRESCWNQHSKRSKHKQHSVGALEKRTIMAVSPAECQVAGQELRKCRSLPNILYGGHRVLAQCNDVT